MLQQPPLALYVHLPWCERKCPYCDFNSHERQTIPEEAYVDALLHDLKQENADDDRKLVSVFIGGGTPSLFSVAALERLLAGIRSTHELSDHAELTMEANPGSAESQRLAGYRQAGITRFSLGIQSFNDACLTALGRIHSSRQARAAITAAKQSGAKSFNLDLMHGLPGQAPEQGLEDLRLAIATDTPHLSWYQLTIEPNTHFYSAPPLLPRDEDLAHLEQQGVALLEDAGYTRYEVSAWSKPGQECQHNLNYWRFGDYLAIGAGAHGKITSRSGSVQRYAKTRQPDDYLSPGGTRRCAQRELTARDLRGEFMLNALRLSEGFSLATYEERTGLSARELHDTLRMQEDAGLLQLTGDNVRTTALGQRFLDNVVGGFFDA